MSFIRRLPVYILLDCSGSMAGDAIEQIRLGLKALIAQLNTDPQAIETAWLSIITFDSTARQVIPLTELDQITMPTLQAGGATALGAALQLLDNCIEREVNKVTTETQKGDWKPLIFVMTDGQPTDTWEHHAATLKNKKVANIIACAAGNHANTQLLKQLTNAVVWLNTAQPGAFEKYMEWVSYSILKTSQLVSTNPTGAQAGVDLPRPPSVIQIIP